MPELSIIVPVYKTEAYLERCVTSILNQSYKDFELILVDDGSPDKCPDICDEYARNDTRINVLHQKNFGVSVARNTGLDAATGDYITFVDSDDYIEKNMYKSMMETVKKYDCDFVLCDCIKDYPNHAIVYTHKIREGYYDYEQLKSEYYPHLLMMENLEYPPTISNWLCLFHRKLLVDKENHLIRYPVGIRFSEDLLFGSQVMYNAESFFYMKGAAFYHYVIHGDSFSRVFVDTIWNDYRNLCVLTKQVFNNKTYDFKQQIDRMFLFFVMKAISEIAGTTQFTIDEKEEKANSVLNDNYVIDMFKRLKVKDLAVTKKQKILIFCYKHSLLVRPILRYIQRKRND